MPHVTRVFQSGTSQPVRLPKELCSTPIVWTYASGRCTDLASHIERAEAWNSLKAAMARGVSDDFMKDVRDQPDPQDRLENPMSP